MDSNPSAPEKITVANFAELEQHLFRLSESDNLDGVEPWSDNEPYLIVTATNKDKDTVYHFHGAHNGVMASCLDELQHKGYLHNEQGLLTPAIRQAKNNREAERQRLKAVDRRWWRDKIVTFILGIISGAVLFALGLWIKSRYP